MGWFGRMKNGLDRKCILNRTIYIFWQSCCPKRFLTDANPNSDSVVSFLFSFCLLIFTLWKTKKLWLNLFRYWLRLAVYPFRCLPASRRQFLKRVNCSWPHHLIGHTFIYFLFSFHLSPHHVYDHSPIFLQISAFHGCHGYCCIRFFQQKININWKATHLHFFTMQIRCFYVFI